MRDEERVVGASESLHKTISELLAYMEDDGPRPSSDLRQFMYEKLADISEWWTQEGFYYGHRIAYERQRDQRDIPATLKFEYGDALLAPNCERPLTFTSRIRRI